MPADRVTLAALAAGVDGVVHGDPTITVTDVTHDSRAAGPGVLFVAVRGARVDGHGFTAAAVAAGTPAVCVDDAAAIPDDAAGIVTADTRAALARLAVMCHGDPSVSLRIVGVTGTNGKTTTTHMIESICVAAGVPEAIVGTVGAHIRGAIVPLERTTPEASDFQRLLRTMVDAGVDVAAVEVSSHALSLGRVDGVRFAVGAFTNLSQDHLDFHGDMGAYEAAKASLFAQCDRAVIWTDDPAGTRIAGRLTIPVTTVGWSPAADVRVRDLSLDFTGSRFHLVVPGEVIAIDLPLPGRFNAANAAIAAGCALALGMGSASIAAGLAAMPPVPGRFEVVSTAATATVVVDYAHTPDGIEQAIAAAREILAGAGRVVAVVGAGGDRDRAKRPLMGRAVSAADVVVLTSDNPRHEDPATILAEVHAGTTGPGPIEVEPDRRRAIAYALAAAADGDVVLILGKGHEQGQDFGDRVVPFDDRIVAQEEARAR